MKKIISFSIAVKGSIILYSLMILFHSFVIIGILFFNYNPMEYIWGGQIQSSQDLVILEIISLFITVLFLFFLLNTIGNIYAASLFEKMMAIISFALSIFSFRLAKRCHSYSFMYVT